MHPQALYVIPLDESVAIGDATPSVVVPISNRHALLAEIGNEVIRPINLNREANQRRKDVARVSVGPVDFHARNSTGGDRQLEAAA